MDARNFPCGCLPPTLWANSLVQSMGRAGFTHVCDAVCRLPRQGFGTGLTFIGVEGISTVPSAERAGAEWAVDPRPGQALRPRNLHRVMRLTREERLGPQAMPLATD